MLGEKRGKGVKVRAKEKTGGGQKSDRVRVMETGSEPETRPQKSNYRSSREGVGPAPRHSFTQHKALPDMHSQTHTQACTNTHTHLNQTTKTSIEHKTEMDKIGEDRE